MNKYLRITAIILTILAIIILLGVLALKRGIHISELSLSNTHISNAHLVWGEKLRLRVEKITIQATEEKSTEQPSGGPEPVYVRDALHAVKFIEQWFTSIDIKQIVAGPLNAHFHYRENESGKISITSPKIELQSGIRTEGEFLVIDIEKISSTEYKSQANGILRIDTRTRNLVGSFVAMLADTLPLKLEVKADTRQLSFSGQGKKPVTDIAPIVELFKLGPAVSPWIIDYLSASQVSLSKVSGTIPYNKPESILQTLHAVAIVKDTEYTFAQGLEPIKAPETMVEFIQGVLKIKPQQATFYAQDAGKSELDINFNTSPFILTAYIRTRAQASGGILTLLEHYGIPFPFEQKEGVTETDLTLAINLSTIDIKSNGSFTSDNSVFEYDGHLLDVGHLDVSLDNTDITLRQINVSKKGQFSARISGELDAAKNTGDLIASIDAFSYKSADAELLLENPQNAPLVINYQMRSDGDTIDVAASSWRAGGHLVTVDKFTTPFLHHNWSGKLPPTAVTISPWLKTMVSGTFQNQLPYADLTISVLGLSHDDWQLNQPEVQIELVLDNVLSVTTKKPVEISFGNTAINLMPVHLTYGSEKMLVHQGGIKIAGQSFPDLRGQLDLDKKTGKLIIERPSIVDGNDNKLLTADSPVTVDFSLQGNYTYAEIPLLGIKFEQQQRGAWSVALKDLAKLNKYSPLMQHYQLEKGDLTLSSTNGSLPWTFNGKIRHPLALLVEGDKPVHDYLVKGNYDGKKTTVDINQKIQVSLAEKISIESKQIGYNLPALMSLFEQPANETGSKQSQATTRTKQRKTNTETGNSNLSLSLTAIDSFVYIDESRRALADELKLTLDKGTIKSNLKFGPGSAEMEIRDNTISLVGRGFNPAFVNKLITYSKYKEGNLEFQVSGDFDNLDAVILIKQALIQDFGVASNVLAFINTVPALLTFRLPGFSKDGLHAKEISAGINYQDGLIKLSSAHLDSKEIDVRGEGSVNLNDNTLDITLNLITGTKKSLGHIPLLGYVLSGDKKKPSITLTVKGSLDDPEVNHTVFKEVSTYPFQLLKRTVNLPAHMVKKGRHQTGDEDSDYSSKDKQ